MSITAGEILRVVAIAAWLDGNLNMNVFNAVVTGGGSPWTDGDIVGDAVEWMDDLFATMTSSTSDELDGSEVVVYKYDPIDDDWDEVGSSAWTWNPSVAGDQLPRGVAALINASTLDPDVQGKKYLGGQVETANEDGTWSSAHLANVALYADEWTDLFVGGTSSADWAPGVWSPTNTNFYAFSGAYIIPTIPAYQRRRKRGVGV